MAANWWKYGLCVFGGLGVGYAVGVRITKNKADEELEQKITDIREIYRNDRKASKPVKPKKEEPVPEDKPDVSTKTSIDMERLSERKERAAEAVNRYSKIFKPELKPGTEKEDIPEKEPDEVEERWQDHAYVVEEFPEDCDYPDEVLNYYADGVVTRNPSDQRLTDQEVLQLLGGNENLRGLDEEGCNELKIVNDLFHIRYTIIFRHREWAEVVEEEPYKATL